MAGVFKSLDQSDVRLTPFRAYKQWAESICYKDLIIYADEANYSPNRFLYDIGDKSLVVGNTGSTLIDWYNNDYELLGQQNLNGTLIQFKKGFNDELATIDTSPSIQTWSGYASVAQNTPTTIVDYISVDFDPSRNRYVVGGEGGAEQLTETLSFVAVYTGSFPEPRIKNVVAECGEQLSHYILWHTDKVGGGNRIISLLADTFAEVQVRATSVTCDTGSLTYNYTQNRFYLLDTGSNMYTFTVNANGTINIPVEKVLDNVTTFLQTKPNYSGSTYQTSSFHIVTKEGLLYLDSEYVNSKLRGDLLDLRQYVGSGREVVSMAYRDGLLGILIKDSTPSTTRKEVTFISVDETTKTVSDPCHFGAYQALSQIYGYGLDNFIAVAGAYKQSIKLDEGEYFTIYKADYNLNSDWPSPDPLKITFDEGNPTFDRFALKTANNKFQQIVHRSLDHLYYQNYYTNNKASFGGGKIDKQYRQLDDKALVVSLPQSRFGEQIDPLSIHITASFALNNSNFQTLHITDDIYGNLYVTNSYVFDYTQNKINKTPIADFTFDNAYRYVGKGLRSFTSSFNRGESMNSYYSNVEFKTIDSSSNFPIGFDLLSAIPYFTSSASSSIIIDNNINTEQLSKLNFENGDFTLGLMFIPTASKNTKGYLLTKEGVEHRYGVDLNGNPFTYNTTTKIPYSLFTSGSKLHFQRKGYTDTLTLESTNTINVRSINTAVITKSGSLFSLFLNGVVQASSSLNKPAADYSNLCPIYIGNTYGNNQGFDGHIKNVKMYNEAFTSVEALSYHYSYGYANYGNYYVGNAMYKQGMLIITSPIARFLNIQNVSVRGTHTIYETEISCTVGAGEFNMSTNPTLQTYDPTYNQYVFKDFVTGSYFKPYVTTVGLYDDYGRMVAVAKLGSPIQLPSNTDTTIVIRFDK